MLMDAPPISLESSMTTRTTRASGLYATMKNDLSITVLEKDRQTLDHVLFFSPLASPPCTHAHATDHSMMPTFGHALLIPSLMCPHVILQHVGIIVSAKSFSFLSLFHGGETRVGPIYAMARVCSNPSLGCCRGCLDVLLYQG